ncbi:hypothetical protein MTO96_029580 [Rhipicephalus appendiculatus]
MQFHTWGPCIAGVTQWPSRWGLRASDSDEGGDVSLPASDDPAEVAAAVSSQADLPLDHSKLLAELARTLRSRQRDAPTEEYWSRCEDARGKNGDPGF